MLKKITLTFAQSLDGRIATSTGESRYISEEGSLKLNQQLRKEHDAILVGAGTVLADNPLLTCRIEPAKSPVRVLLDPSLRTPVDSRIAKSAYKYKTILFYDKELHNSRDSDLIAGRINTFDEKQIITRGISSSDDGLLNLNAVIEQLDSEGIKSLMVEGGSKVLTSFLRNQIWTEMVIVSAAKIIGEGVSSFSDLGIQKLSDVIKPEIKDISIIGDEVCWHLCKAERESLQTTKTVYFTATR